VHLFFAMNRMPCCSRVSRPDAPQGESEHQVRKRWSRCRVRWGSLLMHTVDSGVRNSSLAIEADRICALGSSA
jgi:hypothetical protein